MTQLTNELNAVRRLYESSGDPALSPQIAKLEAALRLERDHGKT
jgi:hypothetical protein